MAAKHVPPISHIEILAPGLGAPSENDPLMRYFIEKHPSDGIVVPACSWEMLNYYAYRFFNVCDIKVALHFRSKRDSVFDITSDWWILHPEKLEFVEDFAPGELRARIYAVFLPYSPSTMPASTCTTKDKQTPWWSKEVWIGAPLLGKMDEEEIFPGARSNWVTKTGARPPWLVAQTRLALINKRPGSSHSMTLRSQARSKFLFLKLPQELRDEVYRLVLDFAGFERLVANGQWSCDRYLPQTPSILLVCRQISIEAREVLRKQPLHLRFCHSPSVQHISNLMSSNLICRLRFVRLENTTPTAEDGSCVFSLLMAAQVVELWKTEMENVRFPVSRYLKIELKVIEEQDDASRQNMVLLEQSWQLVSKCKELFNSIIEPVKLEVGGLLWEYSRLYEEATQRSRW